MPGRILVVDDSTTIQKVIKIAFSRYDVEVIAATSFVEALGEIQRHKPDLLVLDASLSETRGSEDFQRLASDSAAAVLLLIGTYENVDQRALAASGFQHQLKKPFESQDIVRAVKTVLGEDFLHLRGEDFAGDEGEPIEHQARRAPAEVSLSDLPPIQSGGLSTGDVESLELPPLSAMAGRDDFADEPLVSQRPTFIPPPPPGRVVPGRPHSLSLDLDEPDAAPLPFIDERKRGKKAFVAANGGDDEDAAYQAADPGRSSASTDSMMQSELVGRRLQGFLEEEAPALFRKVIEDYCARHFNKLAREILTTELRRLADEKARLLVDS